MAVAGWVGGWSGTGLVSVPVRSLAACASLSVCLLDCLSIHRAGLFSGWHEERIIPWQVSVCLPTLPQHARCVCLSAQGCTGHGHRAVEIITLGLYHLLVVLNTYV
jgi:hypothetical protein